MSLNCPSGRVFVGAGEEVTGEGLEPEAIRGGAFIKLSPGWYSLRANSLGYTIALSFEALDGASGNDFTDLLSLQPC